MLTCNTYLLACTHSQVHYLELPTPDPDTAAARPEHGFDRRTAYSVKSRAPSLGRRRQGQTPTLSLTSDR